MLRVIEFIRSVLKLRECEDPVTIKDGMFTDAEPIHRPSRPHDLLSPASAAIPVSA